MTKPFKLKDATPGTIVIMFDRIRDSVEIVETWYERLADDVEERRVRLPDGSIRYPNNVPIKRRRRVQYLPDSTKPRWDSGFDHDASIWECDGRVMVRPLDATRFPVAE